MKINIFWIAGNVIFDLKTGAKSDVLMLVNSEKDASTFNNNDADAYLNFVAVRVPNVTWSKEPSRLRDGESQFVIKGVQHV
jgi:hypothetical protein